MRVGADPDELLRAVLDGPGQAFTLDHRARLVEQAGRWYRTRSRFPTVHTGEAVSELRRLARRVLAVDGWVERVSAALRRADVPPVATWLLTFGTGHPLTDATDHRDPDRVRWGAVPDRDLDRLLTPALPVAWRDRTHRERARRWLQRLDDRIAAVPADDDRDPGGALAHAVDRHLVDRVSAVVDLHLTHDEQVTRLRDRAAGLRRLLTDRRLTLLSFSPRGPTTTGGPTARVAFGDVTTASALVVLLSGTTSGLHLPGPSLRDAAALHETTMVLAGDDGAATVLDLYDAPPDLGRAADPARGVVSGQDTAAFLAGLSRADVPADRIALVGHSYGAYTAARAMQAAGSHRPVDALVMLGAPGAGVLHRRELGTPDATVWAARAPGDPIVVAADLDEWTAHLPDRLRPPNGPLTDPAIGLGPDPVDPEFGARRLPTHAPSTLAPTVAGRLVRGHVDYLERGTASLTNVARAALGLDLHGT